MERDLNSKAYVRRFFERRKKDTLPVEDTMTPKELEQLHYNIRFTKRHFPERLARNIMEGMPSAKDDTDI